MGPVTVTIGEDRETLVIELDGADATLGAADAECLIEDLMTARAGLAEAVRNELDPHSRVHGVLDPNWTVSDDPGLTKVLIRHPGFGWFAFILSEKSARALYDKLAKRVGEGEQ